MREDGHYQFYSLDEKFRKSNHQLEFFKEVIEGDTSYWINAVETHDDFPYDGSAVAIRFSKDELKRLTDALINKLYKQTEYRKMYGVGITLVKSEWGDWQGLYVDGVLEYEGHSLSDEDYLGMLERYKYFESAESFTVDGEWIECLGNLPKNLTDIPTKCLM